MHDGRILYCLTSSGLLRPGTAAGSLVPPSWDARAHLTFPPIPIPRPVYSCSSVASWENMTAGRAITGNAEPLDHWRIASIHRPTLGHFWSVIIYYYIGKKKLLHLAKALSGSTANSEFEILQCTIRSKNIRLCSGLLQSVYFWNKLGKRAADYIKKKEKPRLAKQRRNNTCRLG